MTKQSTKHLLNSRDDQQKTEPRRGAGGNGTAKAVSPPAGTISGLAGESSGPYAKSAGIPSAGYGDGGGRRDERQPRTRDERSIPTPQQLSTKSNRGAACNSTHRTTPQQNETADAHAQQQGPVDLSDIRKRFQKNSGRISKRDIYSKTKELNTSKHLMIDSEDMKHFAEKKEQRSIFRLPFTIASALFDFWRRRLLS